LGKIPNVAVVGRLLHRQVKLNDVVRGFVMEIDLGSVAHAAPRRATLRLIGGGRHNIDLEGTNRPVRAEHPVGGLATPWLALAHAAWPELCSNDALVAHRHCLVLSSQAIAALISQAVRNNDLGRQEAQRPAPRDLIVPDLLSCIIELDDSPGVKVLVLRIGVRPYSPIKMKVQCSPPHTPAAIHDISMGLPQLRWLYSALSIALPETLTWLNLIRLW
jgi:hypothetical protein